MSYNETYDFESQASTQDQGAFSRRFGVHRVLVRAGAELFKLTDRPLVGVRGITPWWNFQYPTRLQLSDGSTFVTSGWQATQTRAEALQTTVQDFSRARSAVALQWNTMSGVLRVRLNVDVYGWFGRCSGQPLDLDAGEPRKVMLIGGGDQIYIPNLQATLLTTV